VSYPSFLSHIELIKKFFLTDIKTLKGEESMGSATMQGELWGTAARDWAELEEPTHKPLWEAMLEAAGVSSGTRFLDAGCGAGGAGVLAAQRGSQVSGIDASGALISLAVEHVPEGDFRVGDLEALPYEDDAFDAIMAANSVQYAEEPVAALAEIRRVCEPGGGRVVVGTWGAPEDCEVRHILKAVIEALPSPPPGEGPFALSAPGALESLVERAGLTVIGSGEVDCPKEYPEPGIAWRAFRSSGPLQGAIRAVGEEKIKTAVLKALEPNTNGGKVRLENRFRYVTAAP
jgi:SAM-dependent methyltransferase